jgi:hypothetical protein
MLDANKLRVTCEVAPHISLKFAACQKVLPSSESKPPALLQTHASLTPKKNLQWLVTFSAPGRNLSSPNVCAGGPPTHFSR